METARKALAWKAAGLVLLAAASAAAFAAYLRPDMLVSVWNVVLLCFQ
jgi:hypothetical protein